MCPTHVFLWFACMLSVVYTIYIMSLERFMYVLSTRLLQLPTQLQPA
jgi:hypothetical protein